MKTTPAIIPYKSINGPSLLPMPDNLWIITLLAAIAITLFVLIIMSFHGNHKFFRTLLTSILIGAMVICAGAGVQGYISKNNIRTIEAQYGVTDISFKRPYHIEVIKLVNDSNETMMAVTSPVLYEAYYNAMKTLTIIKYPRLVNFIMNMKTPEYYNLDEITVLPYNDASAPVTFKDSDGKQHTGQLLINNYQATLYITTPGKIAKGK